MEEKKIDYRFKLMYAVGIIMVVCGHANGGGISFLIGDWFPYGGIHIALFVFCSGYFFSEKSLDNVAKYISKKIKALIVPLYIYNFFYGILVQLLRLKEFSMGEDFTLYNLFIAPIVNGHQFTYNMAGWFVIPLFMTEILNVLLRVFLKKCKINLPETVFFVLSVVCGLIGTTMACNGIREGWWIVLVRLLYFVPFYELGIYYKRVLEKYERKIPSFWYISVIFIIKYVIVLCCGRMMIYYPSWCNNFDDGPVVPILVGYLGIALWMRICSIMEPVIGRSKWINILADNTFSIMINQFLGFMAVKAVFAILSKSGRIFTDFDWPSFKSNIWWYYLPGGMEYSLIIYVVGSIVFCVLLQKIIDKIWNCLKTVCVNVKISDAVREE